MSEKRKRIYRDIRNVFLIVFLIFAFRSSFYESFRIPTGSMIPTLMIGDFIIVEKFTYGLKVPFSGISFFDFDSDPIYIGGQDAPKRGDVIVFKYPKKPHINYIKRVVGLPGDTIEIKNKKLFVNDKEVLREKIDGHKFIEEMDAKYKSYNLSFFREGMEDRSHYMQIDTDNYFNLDFDKKKVPENNFFVLGDNRDFSDDSRFWGFVPRENIKGRALVVWFSMTLPFGNHKFKIRPSRIGSKIN